MQSLMPPSRHDMPKHCRMKLERISSQIYAYRIPFFIIVTFKNTWYNSSDNVNRLTYTSSAVWTHHTESKAAQDWDTLQSQEDPSLGVNRSVHPLPQSLFIVEFGSETTEPTVALRGFIHVSTTDKPPTICSPSQHEKSSRTASQPTNST